MNSSVKGGSNFIKVCDSEYTRQTPITTDSTVEFVLRLLKPINKRKVEEKRNDMTMHIANLFWYHIGYWLPNSAALIVNLEKRIDNYSQKITIGTEIFR